ncbi:MAG: tRNA N6-adenosine threonylcarbamoyltransferase [Alphaproteobacteria bacterium ADurb.Bin438]|nr:MAG: tRNA N6-adenosine threonylcarbamoyltransferase [Alphaproteobacteria bacterium ADurb.Bin438]
MYLIGIESSCDETASAVINEKGEILSSVIYSQVDIHQIYGGVVPEIAARAHLEQIETTITKTLDEANISFKDLDAVAVASGPGLIGGVIVGVNFGKAIALSHNIPFIAVNHLEGHALSPMIGNSELKFPFLLMLSSGGHCQLLEVEDIEQYRLLGATIDDAAGEAFDKVAKMLGLDYPGGPKIEAHALKGEKGRFTLPIPMQGKHNMDFSFSGLKTATRHLIESLGEINEQDVCDISLAFQESVIAEILDRLKRGIEVFKQGNPNGKHLVVAGGVAANMALRNAMNELAIKNGLKFFAPPLKLCTDNGAMIAFAGLKRYEKGLFNELDFKPRPRWNLF